MFYDHQSHQEIRIPNQPLLEDLLTHVLLLAPTSLPHLLSISGTLQLIKFRPQSIKTRSLVPTRPAIHYTLSLYSNPVTNHLKALLSRRLILWFNILLDFFKFIFKALVHPKVTILSFLIILRFFQTHFNVISFMLKLDDWVSELNLRMFCELMPGSDYMILARSGVVVIHKWQLLSGCKNWWFYQKGSRGKIKKERYLLPISKRNIVR